MLLYYSNFISSEFLRSKLLKRGYRKNGTCELSGTGYLFLQKWNRHFRKVDDSLMLRTAEVRLGRSKVIYKEVKAADQLLNNNLKSLSCSFAGMESCVVRCLVRRISSWKG